MPVERVYSEVIGELYAEEEKVELDGVVPLESAELGYDESYPELRLKFTSVVTLGRPEFLSESSLLGGKVYEDK